MMQKYLVNSTYNTNTSIVSVQPDISGEHPVVTTNLTKDMDTSEFLDENPIPDLTCYYQRTALIKSILSYLKKAFTEPSMADTTRHIMDDSLPNSLKHIISNAEYYGPSLFHLATDIITSFIFQDPSKLSSLQDNGLTDVLMHAILIKDVPVARDILASLPNIFSVLCLNTRCLENFMEYKPFDKIFRVLLSSEYLPAMRRRRGIDTIYSTASRLGNAVDELMRHQISLRTEAMKSTITLLEQLVQLGNNPKYCCQKSHSSSTTSNTNIAENNKDSSDDEYDDDEAPSLANRSVVPLLDYITNTMRFIEGVISNNTTDDHGREFVKLGGLKPLLDILQMKNLPIDFPSSQACQCVVTLCKSILTRLVKNTKLIEMVITNLDAILNSLTDFYSNRTYDSSLLTRAVLSSTLHQLSIVHSHISLLCKITPSEVLISFCGGEIGIRVLQNLNKLRLRLIWEKSICSSEINLIDQQDLKPLLCVPSKLDRALGEFYNLLVRQCSTSQMRDEEHFYQQSDVYTPTAAAKLVASTLTDLLRDGFSFDLPTNTNLTENQIEKIRLTFFTSTIGFATSMLFDEHHRPYMLMLQQFELSKAQDALFSALEWTLDLINRQSLTTDDQQASQFNKSYDASPIEFLNSALMLILRLVDVKSILESPHSISKNTQTERRSYVPFIPLHYLALTHKHAFHVLTNSGSVLWNKPYLLKDHATKIIDSVPSIFCHILCGESQIQKKLRNEKQQQNLPRSLYEDLIQLITSMDCSPEHAIQDLLQRNHNRELDAQKFVELVRTHRTLLNEILRQSTQHLSEGPYHILSHYTSILDFDVKRKYFRHELDRLNENIHGEDLVVHVRRDHVLEDSFKELNQLSLQDWKHRFYIIFDDKEEQNDLLNEWYSIIIRSIFDPNYGLFIENSGDDGTYMPNPLSYSNKNHLEYFKFLGRIIGKSIFDNQCINCRFTRPFYKYILDICIDYTDMASIDFEFYKKLVKLLENDIQQLGLDLTFSLDGNELIPNGSTITVTNENKCEYIRFVCQEKIIGSIKQQMNAFLEGFYGIMPRSLISIFNEQELELLIAGSSRIDMPDLKTNK